MLPVQVSREPDGSDPQDAKLLPMLVVCRVILREAGLSLVLGRLDRRLEEL